MPLKSRRGGLRKFRKAPKNRHFRPQKCKNVGSVGLCGFSGLMQNHREIGGLQEAIGPDFTDFDPFIACH